MHAAQQREVVRCLTIDVPATLSGYQRMQADDVGICTMIQFHEMNRRPTHQEICEMSKHDAAWLKQQHNVTSHDGLAYRSTRDASGAQVLQLFVPQCLREEVLRGLHDNAGHQGGERTEALIRERLYWPGIRAPVVEWLASCKRCTLANMP